MTTCSPIDLDVLCVAGTIWLSFYTTLMTRKKPEQQHVYASIIRLFIEYINQSGNFLVTPRFCF